MLRRLLGNQRRFVLAIAPSCNRTHPSFFQMEEPEAKKRKITAEVERKPELKKQPSKDKLNSSFQAAGPSALPRFNPPRPAPQPTVQPSSQPKTLVKKPSGNLASGSNTFAQPSTRGPSFDKLPPPKTASNMPPPETGSFKPAKTLTATGKGKAPESVFNAPPALKSAAGKARPPQSMQVTLKNVIASEDIVLEEPNSEYVFSAAYAFSTLPDLGHLGTPIRKMRDGITIVLRGHSHQTCVKRLSNRPSTTQTSSLDLSQRWTWVKCSRNASSDPVLAPLTGKDMPCQKRSRSRTMRRWAT